MKPETKDHASTIAQASRGSETETVTELNRWRGWAQFVYLGGGPVTGTDKALRAAVCAAHDAAVLDARIQWHPIETAPKDSDERSIILVAAIAIRDEPATTMFAYWNLRHQWWYRFAAKEPTRIYPTHWMPLPDPPSVPAADPAPP